MNHIGRTLPLFLSQSEKPFCLVLDSSDAGHLCQDDARSTRDRVATPFAQPAEEAAHQAGKSSGLCVVPHPFEEFLMLHKDRRVVLAPVLSVVEARAGTACSRFAVAVAAGTVAALAIAALAAVAPVLTGVVIVVVVAVVALVVVVLVVLVVAVVAVLVLVLVVLVVAVAVQ